MSDSLLTFARTAFDRSDWTTLIQYIREFLAESQGQQGGRAAAVSSQKSLSEEASEAVLFSRLAVQALMVVDFQTRWSLVPLIAQFGYGAIAPLVSILNDFDLDEAEDDIDWDLLWFIARILAEIHHPDAVAALIQILQTSPSEDVVTAAVMALAQQGREAIAPLEQLLGHSVTKAVAAQALAQIFVDDPRADLRDTLTAIIQDPDAQIRALVIDALSHCHHAQVTTCLVQASEDGVATVRQTAVTGLGMQSQDIDHPVLIATLQPRLWDTDVGVRRQAAIALSRLQTAAAATVLATALNAADFPSSLKPEVVRALIWTNTPEGLVHLNHYLQTNTAKAEIYQEIAVMLGRVAVSTLHPQATDLLLDIWANHSIVQQSAMLRQAIATSLGQLGQATARPALIHLTQDEDERVRLHAIAALKALA